MPRANSTRDTGSRRKQTPEGPFNVILISFDTLRRDYVHAYGHPKPLSPVMDRLAKQGAIFRDAVANCGWTLPQHMTMLTGLHPIRHRLIYIKRRCRLAARFPTLAEIFGAHGYVTLGFGNRNAYGGGWQYGFHRGMQSYTTVFPFNNMMEQAAPLVACSLRLMGPDPFFVYIHTNDTHEPFAASEPYGSRWGDEYHNKYEGEVSYVDHYFGMILDCLEELGVAEQTLVVVTSDHGTEFHEHGFLEKKLNLYEEISQVPLIMTLPGVLPAGKEVEGLVETADIAPTILDICGLPIPEQMDGHSLLPRMVGQGDKVPEYVFAHTLHEVIYRYEHFSVRSDRYKFVRTVPFAARPERMAGNVGERFARLAAVAEEKRGAWGELYDLRQDPGEQRNIVAKERDLARQLERRLDGWIRRCGYTPRPSGMRCARRSGL